MIGRVFLNRYEAVRLIGEGGMGRVYLARQTDLGRQVAVKIMHEHVAADHKFRERFQRETRLMARFNHPYAVALYDASLDEEIGPCIVMEYVKGVNLDSLLARNGRFNPVRVGRLIGQLCEVLQAAHEEGMIHRDLKPGNLMIVDPDTTREKIKVMDFGLAKLVEAPTLKKVTDTNVDFAVGTPGYICPEQVRGEEMDHRGDIYAVGVIMYELLTGRLPFQGTSSMDVLLAHATEFPPTFQELELGATIPPSIEKVVFQCLEKEPRLRPQSAREVAERYEQAVQEAINGPATPPTTNLTTPQSTAPVGSHVAAHTPEVTVPVPDPTALNFHMEAWMPQAIAIMKLRGFVHDFGGEVVESIPGLIRVRLGSQRGKFRKTPTALSWLGFGRRSAPIDVELRLYMMDQTRENKLFIHVLFRPSHAGLLTDSTWQERCTQIYIELRAYLMGRG